MVIKTTQGLKSLKFLFSALVSLLYGCATLSMQMSAREVSLIDHNEGIIVGSVVIKGG
jgi:hypothetical protein